MSNKPDHIKLCYDSCGIIGGHSEELHYLDTSLLMTRDSRRCKHEQDTVYKVNNRIDVTPYCEQTT